MPEAMFDWMMQAQAPMFRVEFMRFSARPEVFPARCLITGSTQHVQYSPVYVPNRTGGWVKLTLPFTDLALKRWKMALNLYVFSLAISLFAFCGSVYVSYCGGIAGVLVFFAGIALPILSRKILVEGSGPEIVYCKNHVIALLIPNVQAAMEIQKRVDAHECVMDKFVKMPADPVPLKRKTLIPVRKPQAPLQPADGEVTLAELQRRALAKQGLPPPVQAPGVPGEATRPPSDQNSAGPSGSVPPGTS
jgi:hypothetical protein